MTWEGNIRKMHTSLHNGEAQYRLPLYDITTPGVEVNMNELVGKEIRIEFEGEIHCRETGQLIKKTFGEGFSYKAWLDSPLATESIIRPELSRIHEGIALRDKEWEIRNHLVPHYTYLSLTSDIKVGVTRVENIPSRWIDQGAIEAVAIAKTPYRQAAGLIEVALKDYLTDKTNWRHMIMDQRTNSMSLLEKRAEILELIPEEFEEFVLWDDEVMKIHFPVERYPVKVNSLKLDKFRLIEKKLAGIKGQYLLFGDNTVINLRSHSAYRIKLLAE
jgi:hypothetical protein